MTHKLVKTENPEKTTARRLTLTEIPETGELEIAKLDTDKCPATQIRFPKEISEQYKLPPEQFSEIQNSLEEFEREDREIQVFANSIESKVGYNSLVRVLGNFYGRQMAYFRSEQGGSLSLEEARKLTYQRSYDDNQAVHSLNKLLSEPSDQISFEDLWLLNQNNAAIAENLWEMLKRDAKGEFESGHRAAEVFEPADHMKNAWNRASYLGLRESFCEEWQPKGGIELSMIDAITQAYLQLQFWTKESVIRSRTSPIEESYRAQNQRKLEFARNKLRPKEQQWDVVLVSEQSAIDHAAQMADRWQRMYFRGLRNLRDWRRYTPQVTINNPNQVNIATDGGNQVNVSK